MAGSTSFPSGIDTYYLPLVTDTLLSATHNDRHQEIALAVKAIETKVGVDSSAVTSSLDYKIKNSGSVDPGHLHSANGFSAALLSGWFDITETWTYVSGVSFTVPGDITGRNQPGDKLRWKQGGSYKYGWIKSLSYSAPNTTVTTLGSTLFSFSNAAITNNGFSKMANPVGFPQVENFNARVYRTASVTISDNTPQKINWDTATYNPGVYFDIVTNSRYVAPVDGLYRVTVATEIQSVTDTTRIGSYIYKNGSINNELLSLEGGSATSGTLVSDTVKCAASDYLEGFTFQHSGGSLSLNNQPFGSWMAVDFIALAF